MALQPPAQQQIVPWLIQPLPTLVWVGVGAALLAVVATGSRVRRSSERCPLSPRWLAVTLVVSCGVLAGMAFGGGLLHPASAAAAAVLVVASATVAWAGWHADAASKAGVAQTVGLPLSLGVALALVAVPTLVLRGTEWRTGINVGEALACLLPAAGAPLGVLFLFPTNHSRSEQVRSAVFVFTAAFLGTLTLTTAGATLAASTPLPFESPLAERYSYLNATLATSSILAGLCALSAGAMGWLTRRWQGIAALTLLLVAAFVVNAMCARWTATPAFGQHPTRSVISFACGLLLGLSAWSQIRWRPFVKGVICVFALVLAVRTAITAPAAAGSFAPLWNASLASLGFLTAAATARPEAGAANTGAAGEPVFAASVFAVAGIVAIVLATRMSLIQQATEFSRHFRYDRLVHASDDFRREAVGHPHALHMGGGRFAWVLPQATWWTPDYAWRDALIVTDRSTRIPPDPETTGPYYGAGIVDEQGGPGDADFKDARFVAISQPALVGPTVTVARTTPVRNATPADLAAWANLAPSNPRLWVGLLWAGVLSGWCLRSAPSFRVAAMSFVAALTVTAAAEGLAAAAAVLTGTAAVLALASARRDDRWRLPVALGLLFAVALAVLPVLIRLGDR